MQLFYFTFSEIYVLLHHRFFKNGYWNNTIIFEKQDNSSNENILNIDFKNKENYKIFHLIIKYKPNLKKFEFFVYNSGIIRLILQDNKKYISNKINGIEYKIDIQNSKIIKEENNKIFELEWSLEIYYHWDEVKQNRKPNSQHQQQLKQQQQPQSQQQKKAVVKAKAPEKSRELPIAEATFKNSYNFLPIFINYYQDKISIEEVIIRENKIENKYKAITIKDKSGKIIFQIIFDNGIIKFKDIKIRDYFYSINKLNKSEKYEISISTTDKTYKIIFKFVKENNRSIPVIVKYVSEINNKGTKPKKFKLSYDKSSWIWIEDIEQNFNHTLPPFASVISSEQKNNKNTEQKIILGKITSEQLENLKKSLEIMENIKKKYFGRGYFTGTMAIFSYSINTTTENTSSVINSLNFLDNTGKIILSIKIRDFRLFFTSETRSDIPRINKKNRKFESFAINTETFDLYKIKLKNVFILKKEGDNMFQWNKKESIKIDKPNKTEIFLSLLKTLKKKFNGNLQKNNSDNTYFISCHSHIPLKLQISEINIIAFANIYDLKSEYIFEKTLNQEFIFKIKNNQRTAYNTLIIRENGEVDLIGIARNPKLHLNVNDINCGWTPENIPQLSVKKEKQQEEEEFPIWNNVRHINSAKNFSAYGINISNKLLIPEFTSQDQNNKINNQNAAHLIGSLLNNSNSNIENNRKQLNFLNRCGFISNIKAFENFSIIFIEDENKIIYDDISQKITLTSKNNNSFQSEKCTIENMQGYLWYDIDDCEKIYFIVNHNDVYCYQMGNWDKITEYPQKLKDFIKKDSRPNVNNNSKKKFKEVLEDLLKKSKKNNNNTLQLVPINPNFLQSIKYISNNLPKPSNNQNQPPLNITAQLSPNLFIIPYRNTSIVVAKQSYKLFPFPLEYHEGAYFCEFGGLTLKIQIEDGNIVFELKNRDGSNVPINPELIGYNNNKEAVEISNIPNSSQIFQSAPKIDLTNKLQKISSPQKTQSRSILPSIQNKLKTMQSQIPPVNSQLSLKNTKLIAKIGKNIMIIRLLNKYYVVFIYNGQQYEHELIETNKLLYCKNFSIQIQGEEKSFNFVYNLSTKEYKIEPIVQKRIGYNVKNISEEIAPNRSVNSQKNEQKLQLEPQNATNTHTNITNIRKSVKPFVNTILKGVGSKLEEKLMQQQQQKTIISLNTNIKSRINKIFKNDAHKISQNINHYKEYKKKIKELFDRLSENKKEEYRKKIINFEKEILNRIIKDKQNSELQEFIQKEHEEIHNKCFKINKNNIPEIIVDHNLSINFISGQYWLFTTNFGGQLYSGEFTKNGSILSIIIDGKNVDYELYRCKEEGYNPFKKFYKNSQYQKQRLNHLSSMRNGNLKEQKQLPTNANKTYDDFIKLESEINKLKNNSINSINKFEEKIISSYSDALSHNPTKNKELENAYKIIINKYDKLKLDKLYNKLKLKEVSFNLNKNNNKKLLIELQKQYNLLSNNEQKDKYYKEIKAFINRIKESHNDNISRVKTNLDIIKQKDSSLFKKAFKFFNPKRYSQLP
jgi:hypothetical protein